MVSDIILYIILYLLLWSHLFYIVLPLIYMVLNITYVVIDIILYGVLPFFRDSICLHLYVAMLHYIFCHICTTLLLSLILNA